MTALVILLSVALPFAVFYSLGRWLQISNPYGNNWWRYGLVAQWLVLAGWLLLRGGTGRVLLMSPLVTAVVVYVWWRRDGRFFAMLSRLRVPATRALALQQLTGELGLDALSGNARAMSTRHALYASSALIEAEQPLSAVALLEPIDLDALHIHEQIHCTTNLAVGYLMLHRFDRAYDCIDQQDDSDADERSSIGLRHTRALVLSVRGDFAAASRMLQDLPPAASTELVRLMTRANILAAEQQAAQLDQLIESLEQRYGRPALRQLAAFGGPASGVAAGRLAATPSSPYR